MLKNNDTDIAKTITSGAAIHKHTAKRFSEIIAKTNMKTQLIEAYTVDAWRFSGFKTYRMFNEVKAVYKKGMSHERLIKASEKINLRYNKTYLRAEIQHANNAALSAERWHSFDNTGRYYLQYRTAGDERVRSDHAILNDITLPKDDSFWTEFNPPNGWGCRCEVVEVLKNKYKKSTIDKNALKKEVFKRNNDKPFAFNPGQKLKLFPQTASYYNVKNYDVVNKTVAKQYYNLYLKEKLTNYKKTIHPYKGYEISNENLITGKTTVIRKSVKEVVLHNADVQVKAFALNMIDDIDNWDYIGWSKTGLGKHPEADYFVYYKTTIDKKTRYVNVLMHKKLKTEVIYAVLDNINMNLVIKGKPIK